jgi:hypothetical protein
MMGIVFRTDVKLDGVILDRSADSDTASTPRTRGADAPGGS